VPDLLASLDAFLQEHRRCGDLDAGVEAAVVWMACDCGAKLVRPLEEPPDKRSCRLGTCPSPRLSSGVEHTGH
jgi:hypothetical protein